MHPKLKLISSSEATQWLALGNKLVQKLRVVVYLEVGAGTSRCKTNMFQERPFCQRTPQQSQRYLLASFA
jgi:hypothetical protein